MFREPFSEMRWGFHHEGVWRPPTDVFETDDGAVVVVEIAGLQEGDYEVVLTGRSLIISGKRRDPAEKLAYQQMEIRYGRFRTQVYLPWSLDSSSVEVKYESGMLKVTLHKAKAHRIPVHVVEHTESEEERGQ